MHRYWILILGYSAHLSCGEILPHSLRYLGYHAPVSSRIPPHHYAALKKKIAEGRNLFCRIMSDTHTPATTPLEHFEQIVSLMWGIYDIAVEKDGPFWDGTIIIVDPHKRFFSFLTEYAHTLWKGESHAPRYAVPLSHAYPRHSSHFPEVKTTQWGIDMRSPEGTALEKLLPTAKRHLLFGRLSQKRTFIKFEEYGLCIPDGSIISHGLGYVQSVLRKAMRMNDGRYTRREDIPYTLQKSYQKLARRAQNRGYALQKSPLSIAEMVKEAERLLKSKSLHKRAHKFINAIHAHYDFIEIRRGNEVIISAKCDDLERTILSETHNSSSPHSSE